MFMDGIGSLLGCDERRWCDGSGGISALVILCFHSWSRCFLGRKASSFFGAMGRTPDSQVFRDRAGGNDL